MKAAADVAEGKQAARIRVVDLIAKEKACVVEGMPCDERCPYAVGYYDRVSMLRLMMRLQARHLDRERLRTRWLKRIRYARSSCRWTRRSGRI